MKSSIMQKTAPLFSIASIIFASATIWAATPAASDVSLPPTPPQDQGLPYTRTAIPAAVAKIRNGIAAFAGSRYGYIQGYRVRLSDTDLLHAEAVGKDGVVYVPEAFAALVALKQIEAEPVPGDLASIAVRWVYAPEDLVPLQVSDRRAGKLSYHAPASVGTLNVGGAMYYSLADVARASGLAVTSFPNGLLYAGAKALVFGDSEPALRDSVTALFDTPEKFADPDIATRYVPTLARQGKATTYVKATPEQLAVLNGVETDWPWVPESEYHLDGFDAKLLGSTVPAPGVYPRVLFSPEDVPQIAARVKATSAGQKSLIEMEQLFRKSWWDSTTSDGRVFAKLASGDLAGLEWDRAPGMPAGAVPHVFKGQKPGIYTSHTAYVPECLTSMALYCLLTDDNARGRQVAAAVANYYKLREPLLDEINSISDSEFGGAYKAPDGSVIEMNGAGATAHWRTQGGVGGGIGANMNLGLALDFAGKWMTPGEKDSMRRYIAKATYGVRAYGQDGPRRWRDINWVTWDLSSYLALASIEGLQGFDSEAYATEIESVHAFCDWGIDDSGVIYESNGKTPGGLQFLTLSMIGMARRGENFWGHPHLRKLLAAQVQDTSPSGRVNVNSGTQYSPYSRQYMSPQFVTEMKAFYPAERFADYLLTNVDRWAGPDEPFTERWMPQNFDSATYAASLTNSLAKLRLPSVTYPGFVHGVLFDGDYQPTTRADLNLPLDFSDSKHGLFSSYSDRTNEAAWINMLVRPDHYLGAGHHHADAGMFHFSALGVDWFTQSPFHQAFDDTYFNLVQVDGHSEPETIPGMINGYNARAKYLGAVTGSSGAMASADLTYAYSYRWMTQPPQVWSDELKKLGWEVEPDPEVTKIFAGTARTKMRPWWPTPDYSNYLPTCRAPFNPMQYVYRTTGLIRGAHPYGFVIDDLKKDGKPHLFQWVGILNGGVWKANLAGLQPNEVALAYRPEDPKLDSNAAKPSITPAPGEPLLLVCAVGTRESGDSLVPLIQVETHEALTNSKGFRQYFDRMVINQQADAVDYRVLLIPLKAGEPIPAVKYDDRTQTARIEWPDRTDELRFLAGHEGKTAIDVLRDGKSVLKP